jgi:hypothetical protein
MERWREIVIEDICPEFVTDDGHEERGFDPSRGCPTSPYW